MISGRNSDLRHFIIRAVFAPVVLLLFVAIQAPGLLAQTLAGSRASMERQHQVAINYDYTFLKTAQDVEHFVANGYLVRVVPNQHMELHAVSYPYARPEVKLFTKRLSAQYYSACGEKMTVTSLTRPVNRQPANSVSDSVHPTGMALDLRIPRTSSCLHWLQDTLLSLEGSGVLDVTRERHPPHFHVALFTKSYESYVASLNSEAREYVVLSGDSLSTIAQRYDTTIAQLRSANSIRGDLINVGQKLNIPAAVGAGRGGSVESAVAAVGREAVEQAVEHTVSRGETLWRIANRYGTSVDMLRQENNLAGSFLDVGQILHITVPTGSH